VQFKDQPDTFRVLNGSDVKHLDPEDHEEKKGKKGKPYRLSGQWTRTFMKQK